jgi:acid phosphatase
MLIHTSPLISYDSVMMNGSRLSNIQSFDAFQRDLNAKTLPQYFHMSPNMLNDGHDTTLGYATKWAESYLPPLLQNEYFMNRTLILLTYDESETYKLPNHIASLLLGGSIPADLIGTKDDTFYTHYSILSTLQNNWDLPNLGRYDVGANVFDLVTKSTGWQNQQITVPDGTNLSKSYPGYLNSKSPGSIPPPNKKLTGAGGQGILADIEVMWRTDDATPYDGSGKVFDGDDATPTSAAPITNTVLPTKSVTPIVGTGAQTSASTAQSGGIETIGVEKSSVGSIMALWTAVYILALFGN